MSIACANLLMTWNNSEKDVSENRYRSEESNKDLLKISSRSDQIIFMNKEEMLPDHAQMLKV